MNLRRLIALTAAAGFVLMLPAGFLLPLFVRGPTDWSGILIGAGMLCLMVAVILGGGVPKNAQTRARAAARRRATAERMHEQHLDELWSNSWDLARGRYAPSDERSI